MNESVDDVLVRRLRECTADKHLPPGFPDRLLDALRHRRRMRRLKVLTLIVVLTLVCGLFRFLTGDGPRRPVEAAWVVADRPVKEAQASGWMLLGFFRECFRRNKTSKRKEED